MLRDLQRIADRQADRDVELYKAAAARLLRDQFLFRERVADREPLRLIGDEFDYFENLFAALGWDLKRDEDFGIVGILPAEGQGQARLKLIDTLMVLCLRLLYEEGMDRFEVRDGSVYAEANSLMEHYETLFNRSLPPKGEFKSVLARLRRRGLIETGETDDQGLPRLRILPTIRWITGPAVMQRIEAFAGQEGHEDDEEHHPSPDSEAQAVEGEAE